MTFSEITGAYLAERRAVGFKMERGEARMARIAESEFTIDVESLRCLALEVPTCR